MDWEVEIVKETTLKPIDISELLSTMRVEKTVINQSAVSLTGILTLMLWKMWIWEWQEYLLSLGVEIIKRKKERIFVDLAFTVSHHLKRRVLSSSITFN